MDLPTEEQHTNFWDEIDRMNHYQKSRNSSIALPPFWQSLESALNKELQKFFVDGFDFRKQVTIDDDKVHYQRSDTPKHFEPKQTQHVRDNRRGPVIDTAGFTASGGVVGLHCHRQGRQG